MSIGKRFSYQCGIEDTKYHMLRPSDRFVDSAINTVRMQVNSWSTFEFMLHYKDSVPLFYANNYQESESMHMSVIKCIQRLIELLLFRFKRSVYA